MLLLILVIASLSTSSGLRILSVLPFPQKSHHIVFNALIEELVHRGHEVTVFSGYRLNINASNYKHSYITTSMDKNIDSSTYNKYKDSFDAEPIISPLKLHRFTAFMTDETLRLPHVKSLIKSNDSFDVLLLETLFAQEALLGFSYKFNASVVTLNTFGSYSLLDSVMGNPNPLAYLPSIQLPYNSTLSLYQRIRNAILHFSEQYYSYNHHIPHQEEVMIKHFRDARDSPLPSLIDMLINLPVVLLNTQPEVSFSRAFLPNMINVGGLHIPKKRKPLPEKIQKFIDDATEGVIYFSLGSSFKGSTMPQNILDAFLIAFQNIPERVLWKIDKSPLNISSNVMTLQWAPQNDILSHPKCKAFITHGGLLSLLEAAHFGVPLIGIPLFADQGWNVAKIEEAQTGLKLRINDISLATVSSALKNILHSPIYRRNMKQLSTHMRDRLTESPLDTAVHWVEYVAKHQGAPLLKSPARNLSSFQFFLIDVLLILLSICLICIASLFSLLVIVNKLTVRICYESKRKVNKSKSE